MENPINELKNASKDSVKFLGICIIIASIITAAIVFVNSMFLHRYSSYVDNHVVYTFDMVTGAYYKSYCAWGEARIYKINPPSGSSHEMKEKVAQEKSNLNEMVKEY